MRTGLLGRTFERARTDLLGATAGETRTNLLQKPRSGLMQAMQVLHHLWFAQILWKERLVLVSYTGLGLNDIKDSYQDNRNNIFVNAYSDFVQTNHLSRIFQT